MKRSVALAALWLLVVACSNSNNDSASADNTSGIYKGDLDPKANALDYPPTNGKLPEDLQPPV